MAKPASTTNPDGSTTFVVVQSIDFPGTAGGPVRHSETEHPSDTGLRSVPSLLHQFPEVDTRATHAVRHAERKRVSPFFVGDDEATARIPRVVLTASAPLGGAA